jgi:hypothetical protein
MQHALVGPETLLLGLGMDPSKCAAIRRRASTLASGTATSHRLASDTKAAQKLFTFLR